MSTIASFENTENKFDVNNLTEGIHEIKFKKKKDNKKCKTSEIIYKDCDCFLEYTNFKDNIIETNVYL